MKLSRALVLLFGITAIVLVGCRSNPVYNVTNASIATSTRGYSLSDVRIAIQQAGVSLGWQMKDVRPDWSSARSIYAITWPRSKSRMIGTRTASSTGTATISVTTAPTFTATTTAGFKT